MDDVHRGDPGAPRARILEIGAHLRIHPEEHWRDLRREKRLQLDPVVVGGHQHLLAREPEHLRRVPDRVAREVAIAQAALIEREHQRHRGREPRKEHVRPGRLHAGDGALRGGRLLALPLRHPQPDRLAALKLLFVHLEIEFVDHVCVSGGVVRVSQLLPQRVLALRRCVKEQIDELTEAFHAKVLDAGSAMNIPPIHAVWVGIPVKMVAIRLKADWREKATPNQR